MFSCNSPDGLTGVNKVVCWGKTICVSKNYFELAFSWFCMYLRIQKGKDKHDKSWKLQHVTRQSFETKKNLFNCDVQGDKSIGNFMHYWGGIVKSWCRAVGSGVNRNPFFLPIPAQFRHKTTCHEISLCSKWYMYPNTVTWDTLQHFWGGKTRSRNQHS